MAITLNASTSSGLVQTADTSGIIEIQASGSTKLTVNSSGTALPTATVTTLNTPTGVLAAQNGMTGIPKAWVNFNGLSGASPVVRSSFNVSSVSRTGTGAYTINFTTAMANVDYACMGNAWYGGVSGALLAIDNTPTSTTSKSISVTNAGATVLLDVPHITFSVFSS
jgi:hypothetical protein